MQRETVDEMLAAYRQNAARCEHLRARIRLLTAELDALNRSAVYDGVRITARVSDAPGGGNRTSDSVGQLASRLADGYENDRQRDCREELEATEAELDRLSPAVMFVDAWMMAPRPDEQFVIRKKMIEGLSWSQVGYAFQLEFGTAKSRNGLRSLRDSGMEEIYRLAE